MLLLPIVAWAWQDPFSELKKNLEQAAHPHQQIDLLTQLGFAYLTVSLDSSKQYLHQADSLLTIYPSDALKAMVISRQGLVYLNLGNLASALECFKNSLALGQKLDDSEVVARSLGHLGLVYLTAGQNDRAAEQYHKALHFLKQKDIKGLTGLNYLNLCHVYLIMEKYDSASYYSERALLLNEAHGPFYSFSLYNAGLIALHNQQYQQAEAFAEKAQQFGQKYFDYHDLANALVLKARLALVKNELQQAEKWVLEAVALAETSNRMRDKLLAYSLLSKVYSLLKKPELALHYYELTDTFKDSIRSTSAHNALKVFEYEKKQIEVGILKAEQAQKELILQQEIERQQSQQKFISTIMLLVMLLSIVALASLYKIKKGKRKLEYAYRQIQEKKEEISAQNEEITQQNIEINHFNEHLEELVDKQTKTLLERNEQLSYYAHFNAHKLRAPIATILGLYQVLKMEGSLQEKETIIEMMSDNIENLDLMVKESQAILNVAEEEFLPR